MLTAKTLDVIEKALIRARQVSLRNNSDADKKQTRKVDAALTELAALRQGGEWQPVENGLFYIEDVDNYLTASLGGSLLRIIRSDLDEADMDEEYDKHAIQLDPAKYRLCRFVTPEANNG